MLLLLLLVFPEELPKLLLLLRSPSELSGGPPPPAFARRPSPVEVAAAPAGAVGAAQPGAAVASPAFFFVDVPAGPPILRISSGPCAWRHKLPTAQRPSCHFTQRAVLYTSPVALSSWGW